MAYGLIKQFNESGIRCPKDVSVIGYDDRKRSENFEVPLTTVHVPLYEIAKAATLSLIKHLKSESDKERFFASCHLFPVTLIERRSVQRIK